LFQQPDQLRTQTVLQLIGWVLDLDSQTVVARHKPHFSSIPALARSARITSTFENKPAGIRCSQLSHESRIMMQEILVWAWPRGRVVRGFANNRTSSALFGPVLRNVKHDGSDLSAHQLLAAAEGLSEFLAMRGFDEDEIGALLNPA